MKAGENKILAENTGDLSLIVIDQVTKRYMTFRYRVERGLYQRRLDLRGDDWELFDDVNKAIEWIHAQQLR